LEKRFQETQVIDVNKLNSNEPIEVDTGVNKDETPSEDLVTLRVRTETGKRTVLLTLLTTDTIDKVYKFVGPYLEGGKNARIELRTNFPRRSYAAADPKNLKELGLAPSCALIVNALK